MNKGTSLALLLGAGAAYLFWKNSQGASAGVTLEQIAKLLGADKDKGGGTGGTGSKDPVLTLAQQLRAMAGVDLSNADEWNYFLARVSGRKPVEGDPFTKAFFPEGRPEGEAERFSAEDFVSRAKAAGAVGLDGYNRVGRRPLVIDLRAVPV